MANLHASSEGDNEYNHKKETSKNLFESIKENPALGLLIAMVPVGSLIISATNLIIANNQYKNNLSSATRQHKENSLLAAQQYQEKTLAEYVEFVQNTLFDDYYSNGKDPRIPADSISNFIISKTVTTLKTLENSDEQTELIDFLKQAKIGFLPLPTSKDAKSQDILKEEEMMSKVKDTTKCPLTYEKQNGEKHPKINNSCLLSGINLSEINLNNQNLSYMVLKTAILRGTQLKETQLQKANLRGADLIQADLTKAYLIQTELDEATLTGANLSNADLRYASLKNANLTSKKALNSEGKIIDYTTDLTNANLENANLQGAKLIGTVLRNANLKGVTLNGADLTNANLQGANLDLQITGQKALKLKGVKLCRTLLPDGLLAEPKCKS